MKNNYFFKYMLNKLLEEIKKTNVYKNKKQLKLKEKSSSNNISIQYEVKN